MPVNLQSRSMKSALRNRRFANVVSRIVGNGQVVTCPTLRPRECFFNRTFAFGLQRRLGGENSSHGSGW
jgi:hypothetical protein